MGMFDYVNFECICPVCKSKISEFQTKCGENTLSIVEPVCINNFYDFCNKCGCFIIFKKISSGKYKRSVSGKKNGRSCELPEHDKIFNITKRK